MCGLGQGTALCSELTKMGVDHLSIMIRGQINMCGLGYGTVLWRVWGSLKRV